MSGEMEHTLWLDNAFKSDTWRASCSCGWDGRDRQTHDEAQDDWENHCDAVFMEATMAEPGDFA